ncbi:MAG: alternative ribosome rescue aminoacyl-tRNA hydrolase ArfB [Bacteroidota bacterium]
MNVYSIPFKRELFFTASRSRGKGGQNVNKVSTKIELHFDVMHSMLLTDEQKKIIFEKSKHLINNDGILKIVAEAGRSQFVNKQIALEKFHNHLENCFRIRKKRLATKPTHASREKRIQQKKRKSEKKQRRIKN